MKIKPLLLLLFILSIITCQNYAQSSLLEKFPGIALQNIELQIKTDSLPDTLNQLQLIFDKDSEKFSVNLSPKAGKIDTTVRLEGIGNYTVTSPQLQEKAEIRILPGWLSLVPPLLAIILALVIKEVVVSLLAGIYMGILFIYDYNPLVALLRLIDKYIVNTLTDESHMVIIIFSMLIGGAVGIISQNGGAVGLANQIIKFAKTRRMGMISGWLLGVFIFFDDYANTLIVGNMMRPITDKLRISREKLSYIVDSTSAPVASLFFISTWIGYEIGIIRDGLNIIGSTEDAYSVFIQTIPYRFYPIATLFFVFLVSFTKRDFGSMYKAEYRAITTGELSKGNVDSSKDLTESTGLFANKEKANWINGIVPILVILAGTFIGLIVTGKASLKEQGITEYSFGDIISNASSNLSLLWASFAACLVAILQSIIGKLLTLKESIDAWFKGIRTMLYAMLILTLAWTLGTITSDVKTADYLISSLNEILNPRALPALVFLICAITSFATGTSWGTMAIVMPLAIPLGHKIAVNYGMSPLDAQIIIHGVISSVLAGSIFGDHCSPLADTTILSSMASSCNHVDHVNTQLPYAIIVAVFCVLLGDIPTAFGISPYISIATIFICLYVFLRIFGKKLPEWEGS
ncbi:MAG TPA: Na+/H+ antiporter NhaC family protein [Ignavibacteriales bacterium]|nr:Na+/H+ antiporter NhaC family protein [Ignavibacteriales bacterium]